MKIKERDYLLLRLGGRIKISVGCWEWIGGKNQDGYGWFHINQESHKLAHRYLYQLLFGKVSDKLVIRHLCGNKSCVNPKHLKHGTRQENGRDEVDNGRHYLANRTHCKNGHIFEKDSYSKEQGKRICKKCRSLTSARYRKKRKLWRAMQLK